ncbi:hypothetical protein GALL_185750 [mine drainage metagenome]|uniref:Uncharacterized protein n=1 Tax=mine drainage metagenome TaxID=410659 RepID=A0A1J5RUH8_9ZZZZ
MYQLQKSAFLALPLILLQWMLPHQQILLQLLLSQHQQLRRKRKNKLTTKVVYTKSPQLRAFLLGKTHPEFMLMI